MHVVIAGGHGQVAMHLHPILRAGGHTVDGLIRKAGQSEDLRAVGARPVVCDMEEHDDLSEFVRGADAVIFAAGAGPGSGAERKFTVDRDGAIKLMEAAKKNGIERYVMLSAMNVEEPRGGEVFRAYLQAKAEADAALRDSGLDYTIIRPGGLTDEEATGRVILAPSLPSGTIPRADVAAVLARVLEVPETIEKQFDLTSGKKTISEAIEVAVAARY